MEQKENHPEQQDSAWFDALSGKTDTGQGARLRRMLREIELADAAQEDTAHDWQRLQFALRREAAQESKAGFGLRYFALAASVLILVGAISMLVPMGDMSHKPQPEEEGMVMRGISEQMIFSENPSQEAKQLESELASLGVKISRRETAEKIVLQISLLHPVKDEVRAVLEDRTIPVPDQGDLTVVFAHFSQ